MLKRLSNLQSLKVGAALALILLVFLWPGFLAGKVLFPADILYSYLPWSAYSESLGVGVPYNELTSDMALQNFGWKELLKAAYARGELPLWNPNIFAGMPLLANAQSSPLYPLTALFLLLPTALAYLWYFALHLLIGGLGTFAYLRSLGARPWAAMLSAVAFMLSGVLVVTVQWPQAHGAMVWLPWALLCLERLLQHIESPRSESEAASGFFGRGPAPLRWVAAGAAVLGLQVLAGHPEFSLYIFILLGAYTLARVVPLLLAQRHGSVALTVVGSGLMASLGVALAGAQLIPFAEVVQGNVRAGGAATLDAVAGWALPPRQLLSLLIPDLFGNPTHHSYFDLVAWAWTPFQGLTDAAGQSRSYPFWGAKNYVQATSYIGVLPLLLAGLALLTRRDRYVAFYGGFGLVSLLFALGTPLYGLLLFFVPSAEQLHTPFRWLFPFSFCLIVLAGLGADALFAKEQHSRSKLVGLLGPALLLGGGTLLALLALSRWLLPITLQVVQAFYDRAASLQLAFPSIESLYSYQARNFFLLSLLLLLSGVAVWAASRRTNPLAPALLVAVTCADLLVFGWGYLPFSDQKLLDFQPPALQWLQQQSGGEPFRVATYGQDKLLPPNSGLYAGLEDIRGYDSVIPKEYVAFWGLMEQPTTLVYSQINNLTQPDSLTSPLLDLLNVKYLLSTSPISAAGYTLAYENEVLIYENREALPRAFAVYHGSVASDDAGARRALSQPDFDPRKTVVLQGEDLSIAQGFPDAPMRPATILQRADNSATIQIDLPYPGYLVLTDAYFPGWQATDQQGNELTVLKANGIFRAVALPAGLHTVTFRYAPLSLRLGFLLSLLAVTFWALLVSYWAWLRFRVERVSASTIQRVVKNSVTPMAAQVLARTVDLGFAIIMLRLLGPTSYGGYAFAVVLIGYFAIVTDFGLGTLLTREVSRDHAQADRYLTNTVLLRLALCLVVAPPLAVVTWLFQQYSGLPLAAVLATWLFYLSLIPGSFSGAFSALFSAHEKMEYPAVMIVLTTLLRATVGIACLLVGWGVIGLGVTSLIVTTINALAFWALAKQALPTLRLHIELPYLRGLMGTAAPLMVNNLLNTVFFRMDVLLLQAFLGVQMVGYYHTAYKFVDAPLMISAFLTLALFPVFSRLAQDAPERLLEVYSRSVKGLLILSLPIALGVTLLAEPLILLFFGDAYAPAIRPLQLLIWFLPLSYVNGVTQYILIAINRQRFITVAFLLGAGFNLLANLYAIPKYGMEGAAVTTVLSEIVLLVPFLWQVRLRLGGVPFSLATLRPLLALGITLAALAFLNALPLWWLAGLGIGLYLILLPILRVFDGDDKALLRRLVAR